MTRAIIYTRFSPRRNAGESESCEVQQAYCEQYCAAKGYTIKAIIHDPDISGADEYRENLWKAIDRLERGDVLLVFKRDRLARNVYLSEQINRAVTHKGGTIEAVSGDIEGDGPEQIMIRQVLASIAEYERKLIGQRTSYAMRRHQTTGRRMSRHPPYGWSIDPDDPAKMIPNSRELTAIERIQELHEEHTPTASIVRILNLEHPEWARSGKWNYKTVQKILDRA
jgi:site-specific DNA recombinase